MVPQSIDLREEILREFHCPRFVVHKKMYHDLRRLLEWDEETRWKLCFVDVSHVSR